MTPISTAPAFTKRTPPSAISFSRHTSTSGISSASHSGAHITTALHASLPLVQLGNRKILPARHVGDLGERLAERARRVDADARGGAQRPRLGWLVDRGIGGPRRNLLDDDRVLLRL